MKHTRFERILVPTELTPFTDVAMGYARLFQRRLASTVTLMYANEISWVAAEHPIGYYIDNVPEQKLELQHRLADFAKRYALPGLPVETLFVDGEPSHAIASAAEETDADLIVMSTHARHGLPRAILGSVARRVLRDTTTPVLTVVPGLVPSPQLRSVLCPVNFSELSRVALDEATDLAAAFDAQLIVMHVVEGEPPLTSDIAERFAAWVDPLVRHRTTYQQIIIHGDAAARIATTAEAIGASVVVVGAKHELLADRTVIGSSLGRIMRSTTRPLLTVVAHQAVQKRRAA
jgi:nucleotide-binding universal stress UspA family protein